MSLNEPHTSHRRRDRRDLFVQGTPGAPGFRVAAVAAVLGALACGGGAGSREGSGAEASGTTASARDVRLVVDSAALERAHAEAAGLTRLRSLLVAHRGELVAEWYFNGADADDAANLKSASKSIISALVGIAIADSILSGVDQRIAPLLEGKLPDAPDPRLTEVTIGHLLSMRAGLESTSFQNYGRWVTSRDWVRHALARPFVAEPGGRMIYSTGNTHLLSAVLTRATGKSTWAFARERLAEPLGIQLPRWQRDPQGIYFGGNNMQMTPLGMLSFGELYRNGGRWEGRQVVPEKWVRASWLPRTVSPWNGHRYGYGWWTRRVRGHTAHFAWGYGGQYIFIFPDLELTVVMTSDPTGRARGYRSRLHFLLAYRIIPALRPEGTTLEGRRRHAPR